MNTKLCLPASVIACACAVFILAGCAPQQTMRIADVSPHKYPLVPQTIELDELIAKVDAANSQINAFKANIHLNFTDNVHAQGKTVSCGGKIAIEKPHKLRMYCSQVLGGKLFDIISNGERFYVYSPKEGRVLTGSSTRPFDEPQPVVRLRPNDVMNAFLLFNLKELTDTYISFYEYDPDSRAYIIYLLENQDGTYFVYKKIWANDLTFEITRHQTFIEQGLVNLDVHILDFYDLGDKGYFPKRIEIISPYRQLNLIMEFSSIEMNPSFNEQVFSFTVPENVEIIEMD